MCLHPQNLDRQLRRLWIITSKNMIDICGRCNIWYFLGLKRSLLPQSPWRKRQTVARVLYPLLVFRNYTKHSKDAKCMYIKFFRYFHNDNQLDLAETATDHHGLSKVLECVPAVDRQASFNYFWQTMNSQKVGILGGNWAWQQTGWKDNVFVTKRNRRSTWPYDGWSGFTP